MTLDEYLEAEFRRYFPDAQKIVVGPLRTDELIFVDVHTDSAINVWCMEIGSDDDWYSFTHARTGSTITIPLMPEA